MSQRFAKNSFFGSVAALAATFGAFLSGILIARIGGVEGIGTYSLAVWIISIVTTMTAGGLPLTLTRYLPELADIDDGAGAKRLAAFVFRPILLFSILPTIVALAYGGWLSWRPPGHHGSPMALGDDRVLCLLIGLSCTTQGLADFSKAYFRGIHRLDLVARLTAAGVLTQVAVIAVGTATFGVRGAMIGYLVGVLIPALPLWGLLGVKPQVDPELRRRLFRYAKFRWVSEIAAAFVFSRIEVFFLQFYWGVASVGLLTSSLTLANLAVQGPLMLTWGLLPHFSEQYSNRDEAGMREAYATGTRVMGFMIFPACFGLSALVPTLLPLIFGQPFEGAVPSAMLLVAAASVSATATIGANLLWAMERSDVDLYLSILGAGLSIAGGILLIGPYNIMGAAFSRAITQFIVIGVGTWFIWKRLGFPIPFQALGRLMAAALLCAAAARGCLMMVAGWQGVILAIPVGTIVYLFAVRLFNGLAPEDRGRLATMIKHVPLPRFAQGVILYALR